MAINAVEVRIRSYNDEQLSNAARVVVKQMLSLALGVWNKDSLYSLIRVATLSKLANGRGFMDEEAIEKDVATYLKVSRVSKRMEVLAGLGRKLDLEARRRQIYSGV